MVCQLAALLKKPCGGVINKQDAPYAPLEDFCREAGLPILARIPYDPEIAALAARGELAVQTLPEAAALFTGLLSRIGGAA